MTYKVITPPTEEPLSLQEVKDHLRVDHVEEDALIVGLTQAAREYVEGQTLRQLVTATLRATVDSFPHVQRSWSGWAPARGRIVLERAPVVSVTSITYVDTVGVTQTLATSEYVVHTPTSDEPAWIEPTYSSWWPSAREQSQAVVVTFVAGYGAASAVPRIFKQAMLLLIGHWFENRETVVTGTIATNIPMAAQALIDLGRWEVH